MTHHCEPVFVVGMNGSGTSMMLDSLGRHPELFAIPDESHMMPYIISRANRFGDLAVDENFRACWQFAIDQLPILQRMNNGIKPVIPENWSSFARTIEGIFDGIFGSFADQHQKRRWCEKTPDHIQHLELLSRVFPNARFIHMIRDGREVACSLHRRQRRTPELILYRWRKSVKLGRKEGGKIGDHYMEIRYEELTCDPREQMGRACEFLGLTFSEQVLQSRMPQSPARKRLTKGELGVISKNPLKWPDYFDDRSIRRLEQIGGRLLRDLGYDVKTSPGDSDPNWFIRKFWRGFDYLRRARGHLGIHQKYDSVSKIMQNMSFSLKEYLSKRH